MAFKLQLAGDLIAVDGVRGALRKVAFAAGASLPANGSPLAVALDELAVEVALALASRGAPHPTVEEVRAALARGDGA
jgi:hypothetical protein